MDKINPDEKNGGQSQGKKEKLLEIAGLAALGFYILFLVFAALDDYNNWEILSDFF